MELNNQIFKDYTLKIKTKSYFSNSDIVSTDINNLIVFLNYCFNKKNNFFVDKFNKKNIFPVCTGYNTIKTNVLSPEPFNNVNVIFSNIDSSVIKTVKFILYNFINNYDVIIADNSELRSITKDSIKNTISYLNNL